MSKQHPVTKAKPTYTTDDGTNIYELIPTNFLDNKSGEFYYANFVVWQQLNMGVRPIESRRLYKEIINIGNSSEKPQEKVNKISKIAYQLLTHDAIAFSKSLFLSVCGQFFYTDKDDPKNDATENISNALVMDPKAYDFFLRRLEPLFANSLNISKDDMTYLMEKNEKAVNLVLENLEKA